MRKYNILHIEDSKTDADLVKRLLERDGLDFGYMLAENEKDITQGLDEFKPDIILCDHTLPSFNSKMAFALCKEKNPDIPFILVTGTVSEEFAVEMMKKGVDDYLLKTNLARLPKAIRNVFEKKDNDRKVKEVQLELQGSESKLRSIFENTSNGFLLVDANYTVLEFNNLMSGFTKATIGVQYQKNDNLLDFLPADRKERLQQNFEKILKGESIHYESIHKPADGTTETFSINMNPVRDAEGKVAGACIAIENISEKKKAELKLRQNEEKYRLLFERNLAGIFQTTPEGTILTCNDAFAKMFGYGAPEELIQKKASILYFTYTDRDDFLAHLWKKGELSNLELKMKKKDGSPVYVIENCSLRNDPLTGEEVIDGVLIDVTELKEAGLKLKQNEEKYRNLVEQAADGILIFDLQGNFISVNTSGCVALGYDKAKLLTLNLSDITPDKYKGKLPINIPDLLAKKTVLVEREFKRRDGIVFFTEISAQLTPDGNIQAIVRDISDRKKAEEELKQSEEKYKLLFQSNPLPMWVLDMQTFGFLAVNNAALQHYGYSREEFLALTALEIRPEEEKQRFKKEAIVNQSALYQAGIWKHMKRDGSLINVEIFAYPFIYEGRKAELILVNDVTEKMEAEEKLRQSFNEIRELSAHLQNLREEERTHMAREIHDELGQQLTVMKMDVSWLNDKLSEAGKPIRQRTESLKAMLDSTVATVRHLAYELRPSMLDDMGLGAAVEWLLSEFEKRSGVKTKLIKPENEPDLPDAVKTGLFRIVQESLTNVGRYAQAKNVKVHMQPEEKELALTIQDDGIGFDKEKVAAKKTLGILGMKERTSIMGGIYEINSEPGKGTVVSVKVPVNEL